MAEELAPQQTGMEPAMFDELYGRFFQETSPVERYFRGDMHSSRREDIEDSYSRYGAKIDSLFPDQDEETRRRILAVSTFFERIGCESGIVFAKTQMIDHGNDSDASFRRRVTESGLQ